MNRVERTSFRRNLGGFLGSSWLSRTTSATRLARVSRSLATEPIEPLDETFSSLSENYGSQDHLAGFQAVTRQLLANDVLSSLIQAQSDMLQFDQLLPYEPDILSAHAAHAYQYVDENLDPSSRQPLRG